MRRQLCPGGVQREAGVPDERLLDPDGLLVDPAGLQRLLISSPAGSVTGERGEAV